MDRSSIRQLEDTAWLILYESRTSRLTASSRDGGQREDRIDDVTVPKLVVALAAAGELARAHGLQSVPADLRQCSCCRSSFGFSRRVVQTNLARQRFVLHLSKVRAWIPHRSSKLWLTQAQGWYGGRAVTLALEDIEAAQHWIALIERHYKKYDVKSQYACAFGFESRLAARRRPMPSRGVTETGYDRINSNRSAFIRSPVGRAHTVRETLVKSSLKSVWEKGGFQAQ
jgi:hypothetical protein